MVSLEDFFFLIVLGKSKCNAGKDDAARKRRSRKWVTKQNRGCTSQIIAHRDHTDEYTVIYYKTHYGHDTTVNFTKLSKADRGSIASKLILGLPISTVLESAKNSKGLVKRVNLVSRKDLNNIRKAYNINSSAGNKLSNMDVVNINTFLQECNNHEQNPILYSSLDEPGEANAIVIIIMSHLQSQIFQDPDYNIFVFNSVTLSYCDFDLITLFVVNSSGESYPATCMFTNDTTDSSLELFFRKIRERVGELAPQYLFTNCEDKYQRIWSECMNSKSKCFYHPQQVDIDIKLNLNKIVSAQADVTRAKRQWLSDTLRGLRNMLDENDFLETLDATLNVLKSDGDFRGYFNYHTTHFTDVKKWANVYKIDETLPMKQIEVVGDVLKHYLGDLFVTRFDKIFHCVIRFLRDETVYALLKISSNRVYFAEENDDRHKLGMELQFFGTHLGEDVWKVSGEECGSGHLVYKYLEQKCCSLTCTTCLICVHCFSCTCVDFFISNVICVHIHYIWVTHCQSIVKNEDTPNEEIIIEMHEQGEEYDNVEDQEIVTEEQIYVAPEIEITELRESINTSLQLLQQDVSRIDDKETLRAVLDTLNQLCDTSCEKKNSIIIDHQYL